MAADFQGPDSVVAAFKSRGLPTWAIFNKKNLMHYDEGEGALSEYLGLLADNFSRETYTLKAYKVAPDEITSTSPDNGSFTFKLDEGYSPAGLRGMGGMNTGLMARLAAIEKKLSGESEAKPETTIGKITNTVLGWLEDPDDVIKIIGAFKMLTQKSSSQEILQTVASLAGIDPKRAGADLPGLTIPDTVAGERDGGYALTPAQEMTIQRYAVLIDAMEKCDPEFIIHLEQLLKIAKEKPDTYKMALSFLK